MIRVATPADAPGIARVHVDTWRAAYAGLVPAPVLDALSVPVNAARWEGLLADPATRTWVAVAGDVVAFAAAGPPRDADLAPPLGEVYAVYVAPAAQGGGLGRALLAAATAWIGPGGAALWVLAGNAPAQAFYTACGWAPDGAGRTVDVGGAMVPEVRFRTPVTSTSLAR